MIDLKGKPYDLRFQLSALAKTRICAITKSDGVLLSAGQSGLSVK
jgi:hypothetical protein